MKRVLLFTVLGLILVFTGCAKKYENHYTSSVVDYLYPDKNQGEVKIKPSIPLLKLPTKVGIAFVPTGKYYHKRAVTEVDRVILMKKIRDFFKKYKFVSDIELIPSAYLNQKGGFPNLDQIKTMYDVDLIVLLSYDQTQFTNSSFASVTYWTVIGAYIVPGEKNETHTMVDATVYDIKSRKLLFRAPGISRVKSHSTPISVEEARREDRVKGFNLASVDLIKNLDLQLAIFKDRIKEKPKEYKVVHKPSYSGGGSLDLFYLMIFAIGGLIYYRKK